MLISHVLRAIDEAVERLGVVIALRQAPEATPPGARYLHGIPRRTNLFTSEKRSKRPRPHSPPSSSTPPTSALTANSRNCATPTQRGSAGPQPSTPSLRETKARRETLRETLLRQLPLQEGRMVAFHPPSSGKAADGASPEDMTWIMAKIVRSFHQDKYR